MDYLRLIRWKNVLMVIVTQLLTYFFVITPFMALKHHMPVSGAELAFFLAASVFIVSGGYVINDYYDVEIDYRNKSEKTVVRKKVSEKRALYFYLFLTLSGIVCGVAVGVFTQSIAFGGLMVLAILLLWLYSFRLKRMLLSGNIIVAILAAAPVYSVLLLLFFADCHQCNITIWIKNHLILFWFVTGYSFFAVITHFLREIIKDIQDREGDKAHQCQTLPVKMGNKSATRIAIGIAITVLLLILLTQAMLFRMGYELLAWYGFLVDVLLAGVLFRLTHSVSPDDYGKTGNLVKVMMLAGIFSMILIPLMI